MRALRLLAAAIAFTVLAAVGVATDRTLPAGVAAPRSALVTSVTAVCPDVSGRGAGYETRLAVAASGTQAIRGTTVTVSPLDGHSTGNPIEVRRGYSETATRSGGPVAVSAVGPGAAEVTGSQVALESHGAYRGLAATNCVRPAADWWFAGADGRVGYDDELVLADPAAAAATVQVSLLSSSSQPVTAPSLQSVSVPAHGSTTLELAKVAPDVPDLAVHVHANEGVVTAALRDGRIDGTDPQGSDWIPASPAPADTVLVPGLTAGDGDRHLIVANPGRQAVTGQLHLVTGDGSFAPNGHSQLDIPGHQTATLDLRSALQGRYGAVEITADHPVLASVEDSEVLSGELPDLLWRSGGTPLRSGDVWPQVYSGDGRTNFLALAAPSAAARLTIRDAAGHTAVVPVAARSATAVVLEKLLHATGDGAGWVSVESVSGGPVYAVLTVRESGAHGPLVAGVPPVTPPSAIRLPAIRYDQQIAVNP